LWYFPQFLASALPPISFILGAGVLLAWIRKPRLSLTWVTLPFFLVHCLLGHKELRFLFPMVLAVPYLGVLALQTFPRAVQVIFHTRAGRAVVYFLAAINVVALVARTVVPPRQEIAFFRAIYQNHPETLLVVGEKDPYNLSGVGSYFYRYPG